MVTALQSRQGIVFVLGWLAYASTYLLRKPLGVVKADLESDLNYSTTQLGWLDTALLLPYAMMQILLGSVGDRFGVRVTFGYCLIMSALSMFSFGFWSNLYIFGILLFLNGTAQSQCWPNGCKALGMWFPDDKRNSVFGIFGTCAFAGGVGGTALAVYLQTTYGWRSAFLTPSVIVGILGILVLLLYKTPAEVGIEVPGKVNPVSGSKNDQAKLSLLQLWKIPMIPEVAVAVFCLKVVRYCMYMWLPMYLLKQLEYTKSEAGMFSTMFEVGGVAGSALIGIIIDRCFGGRTLFGVTLSTFLSSVALAMFSITSSWGIAVNSVFMVLAGAFNCGPDSLLGGSVPNELGEMDGRNAGAAAVGLVNGFGSVGTFLEGPIIGFVSQHFGWSGMFYLMIGLSLLGTLAVFRASVIYAKKTKPIIPLATEKA